MGRPTKTHPTARTIVRSGMAIVYWKWQRKHFEASAGPVANIDLDSLEARAQLALQGEEDWPPEIADAPAVLRWESRGVVRIKGDILESYSEFIQQDVTSAEWAQTSINYVKKLLQTFPDPSRVNAKEAYDFFARETKDAAIGTRNKKLQAWSKFFAYLKSTNHIARNPLAGIKYVKERTTRNADIVYLSKKERAFVLAKARHEQHGTAAWLGICIGVRRKEAFSAEWRDINWESETIYLPESKNGAARTIPIPTILLRYLQKRRKKDGSVVPWNPQTEKYKSIAGRMIRNLERSIKKVPADHIGFNPFRHTFASHLVQAGVSLSKVAYFLGDNEETVRRHYSRFIPKDRKDTDIDLAF